jgi:thiol-disulfide isomerase/thioredoxin
MFERKTLAMWLTAVALSVTGAWAQTATDLLAEAAGTLREAKALQAGLVVRGEGAEMFRSTLPTGTSKVLLRQVETAQGDEGAGEPQPLAWALRLTGRGTSGSTQEPDPIDFDLIRLGETDRWVDHRVKKVFELPSARAVSARSSAYMASRLQIPTELLQAEPLKDELAASETSLSSETTEVDGVPCHVIEVTYPTAANAAARGARLNQRAKFYIGTADHLIRRIDRISGSGAMSMTIVLEFSSVNAKAELVDRDFELALPAGYELTEGNAGVSISSTSPRVRATPTAETPRVVEPRVVAESFPPAPDFSVVGDMGEAISLESLRGAPAVLYFWGTWCMECREYNPLVSELAGEYADRGVRVLGMASRERDPSAASSVAALRSYAFESVAQGGAAAEAFGVEVFPTIVVLSSDGGLVGTQQVRRGASASEVMNRVRALLTKALPTPAAQPDDATPGDDAP